MTLIKFLLLFFGIGGLLLILFQIIFFKGRNQKGEREHKTALEFFQTRIKRKQLAVKCNNWNPGIKNHAYLFNLADLFLVDNGILVIPYVKSILGLEKWTPIFLYSKKHDDIDLPDGILKKKISLIEQTEMELKVFFEEKNLIKSTVELNFKFLEKVFLERIAEWGDTSTNKV